MPEIGNVFYGFKLKGKERTLQMRVTGSIPRLSGSKRGSPDIPGDGFIKNTGGTVVVESVGSVINRASMMATAGSSRACGWMAVVDNGFGATQTVDNRLGYIQPLESTVTNDATYESTFSLTKVQLWAYLYFLDEGVRGADGMPTYGGTATDDIIRAIGIAFYEVAAVGAVATASVAITAAHASASASASSTLTEPVAIDYYGRIWALAGAFDNSTLDTLTSTVTALAHDSWTDMGPRSSVSATDGLVTVIANNGTCSVSANSGTGTNGWFSEGIIDMTSDPPRSYKAYGVLYSIDEAYPDPLNLTVQGVPTGQTNTVELNPDGFLEFDQRVYTVYWEDHTGVDHFLDGLDEWDKVRLVITGLADLGVDPTDWRTMIWGMRYPGFRASHAAEVDVGGGSGASRAWSPLPSNFGGYRYLAIRLKTDAAEEDLIVATDSDPFKTYTIKSSATPGGWITVLVDLCFPASPLPDDNPELQDSFLPIRQDGLSHFDKSGWGIGRIRGLTVSGGTNLVVDTIHLHREEPSDLDIGPAYVDYELVQTDESYHADGHVGAAPIVEMSRGLVVTSHGKRAQILPVAIRQLFTDAFGAPIWVYSGPTMTSIIGGPGGANSTPGHTWDTTPYVPIDPWHAMDGTGDANWIDGGDIYYAGWSGFANGGGKLFDDYTCTDVFRTAIGATPVEMDMQVRYDEVIAPPGIGDCWTDGGDYDVPIPLRTAKTFRAFADGLVLGAAAGATVLLKDAGTTVGTGVTDAWLKFRTGTPYGEGQRDHTITDGTHTGDFVGTWDPSQGLGTEDATQNRFNARRGHRVVFRGGAPTVSDVFHMCFSAPNLLHTLFKSDGLLTCLTHNFAGISEVHTVSMELDVNWAQISFNPLGYIFVMYTVSTEGDDAVRYTWSGNWGRVWDTPVTLFSGKQPAVTAHPTSGAEYVAVFDAGAGEWTLYKRAGDSAVFASQGTIASGSAGTGGALEVAHDSEYRLVFLFDDGGTIKRACSPNGGGAWDVSTIASGTRPCLALSREARSEFYALYDGTDWQLYRMMDVELGAVDGPSLIVAGPDKPGGLEVGTEAEHRLVFMLFNGTDAVKRYTTLNLGGTWDLE